jgi:hypothetical protein
MRPPWLSHSREDAELEALQTDVMRFMAILGLCLAAIFSLVQSAAQEQAAGKHTPIEYLPREEAVVEAVAVEQVILEQARVEHVPVETLNDAPLIVEAPLPLIAQTEPVVGFTLEFASVQALEALLQAGQVQLYARYRDQFWSVDTEGVAIPVATPSSYYQMHTETVPQRLRNSPLDTGIPADIVWGVTLPNAAAEQIQRLTTGREGGNLLIEYDGVVVFESTH